MLSLFIVRAECNWHPLGSAQEQAYCPLQRILVYMALELLSLKSRLTLECSSQTSLLVYMALVRALQLFFRGCRAARLHDSRGQSHFSFSPVVLWSVWELHISHNGVSSVVLWWNGASRLVYMAPVVRVSSVLLWWKRGGSSTWLLSPESLQLQLCFGGCGTARRLWQYVELHAPLWLMTLDSTRLYC